MADILIRGMEMPTKGNPLTVLVYPDGTATWKDCEYEAVELPPHGDLIDRDAFDADARKRYCGGCDNINGLRCRACWVDDMLGEVDDAPTVSPDEVRGEGCHVCQCKEPLPEDGMSHEYYIRGNTLYHYDTHFGWEGAEISYCPECGARLEVEGDA